MASHFFDIEIAKEYGLVESILFQNIAYWVEKNRANGENFFDGTFWTYNSIKAFEQLFPYLTGKKIRGALSRLVDAGLIITGNYNKSAYDRTLWYGLTEKGFCIFKKDNVHFTQRANGSEQKGEPIPDINTDNKPNEKPDITPPTPLKGEHPRKKAPPKLTFGEYKNVKLTQEEHDRLCKDYGEEKTKNAIAFFDCYIEEKGYKSKSHNLAMRRWVFQAAEEAESKKRTTPQGRTDGRVGYIQDRPRDFAHEAANRPF